MKKKLLFAYFLFVCLGSCVQEDDGYFEDEEISEEAFQIAKDFSLLMSDANESEKFLFVTDPHNVGQNDYFDEGVKNDCKSAFSMARQVYQAAELDFCLCGGDILLCYDTQDVAKKRLLWFDDMMHKGFSNYYKMLGNHDLNYLGIVSESDSSRGDLPREFFEKEYFAETGSAYYSFKGEYTRFYIFDSGLDTVLDMDSYRWEQVYWFAQSLKENDDAHNAIGIHMFFRDRTSTSESYDDCIMPMSQKIIDVCDAYNAKTSLLVGDRLYNYSDAQGKVQMVFAGHNHIDNVYYVGTSRDIAVIRTTNFNRDAVYTFDMCYVNYDSCMLETYRVGYGESRKVKLYQ